MWTATKNMSVFLHGMKPENRTDFSGSRTTFDGNNGRMRPANRYAENQEMQRSCSEIDLRAEKRVFQLGDRSRTLNHAESQEMQRSAIITSLGAKMPGGQHDRERQKLALRIKSDTNCFFFTVRIASA
jgi:hypothetical protein